VEDAIAPHVGRVVIANPRQVRMIAHAKIKTDTIDATVLAKLYASNFLPEVWVADPRTPSDAAQDDRAIHPARSPRAAVPAYRPVWHQGTDMALGAASSRGRG
jgi:hypothetical protein